MTLGCSCVGHRELHQRLPLRSEELVVSKLRQLRRDARAPGRLQHVVIHVQEGARQLLREEAAHTRLAGARRSHEDDVRLVRIALPEVQLRSLVCGALIEPRAGGLLLALDLSQADRRECGPVQQRRRSGGAQR